MKLRVTTALTSILFFVFRSAHFYALSTTTISEAIYVDSFVHFKSKLIDSLLVLQQIKPINKRMKNGLNVNHLQQIKSINKRMKSSLNVKRHFY